MQTMTQAVTQIDLETTKAVVRAMTEMADLAVYSTKRNAAISGPKAGGPQLKQLIFDWSAQDKYNKLKHLKLEVRNVFMTINYDIREPKEVAIMKNLITRESLHFIETWTIEELEICKNLAGLFKMQYETNLNHSKMRPFCDYNTVNY